MSNLILKLPRDLIEEIKELSNMVREMAPKHGRSTYGEPNAGLTPMDIFKKEHALITLKEAKKAKIIVEKVLKQVNIKL